MEKPSQIVQLIRVRNVISEWGPEGRVGASVQKRHYMPSKQSAWDMSQSQENCFWEQAGVAETCCPKQWTRAVDVNGNHINNNFPAL